MKTRIGMCMCYFACLSFFFVGTGIAKDDDPVSSSYIIEDIWDAIKSNDLHRVESVLTRENNLHDVDHAGQTPLMVAASLGHTSIVDYLVNCGANIHDRDREKYTPFLLAAKEGHPAVVTQLLQKNPSQINDRDATGSTALILATIHGHSAVVDTLLHGRYQADVNATDHQGKDAIIHAAHHKRVNIMNTLFMKDICLQTRDIQQRTALMHALINIEPHTPGIVNILTCAKVNPNATDNQGNSPLILATKNHNKNENDVLRVVRQLIRAGADIQHRDYTGTTPLMWATKGGFPLIVDQLIQQGAEVNVQDRKGNTALMWASGGSNENTAITIVTRLLDAKARVNIQNEQGINALMDAARSGQTDVVNILLQAGANVRDIDHRGNTALTHAAACGEKVRTVAALLAGEAKAVKEAQEYITSVSHFSLPRKEKKTLKKYNRLLAKTPNVNTQNVQGNTPLIEATRFCCPEIIEQLLDSGVDPLIWNHSKKTALMIAELQFSAVESQLAYVKSNHCFAQSQLAMKFHQSIRVLELLREATNNAEIKNLKSQKKI